MKGRKHFRQASHAFNIGSSRGRQLLLVHFQAFQVGFAHGSSAKQTWENSATTSLTSLQGMTGRGRDYIPSHPLFAALAILRRRLYLRSRTILHRRESAQRMKDNEERAGYGDYAERADYKNVVLGSRFVEGGNTARDSIERGEIRDDSCQTWEMRQSIAGGRPPFWNSREPWNLNFL